MLTAIDTATDRSTFLLYGTELGASGQVEKLQQALQALSQTGLALANPGSVDGVVGKRTVLAILYVVLTGKINLESALKMWIYQKAADAAAYLGGEILEWLTGADEAYAELVSKIEEVAPILTLGVQQATTQRTSSGGVSPTSVKDRLMASRDRTFSTTPQRLAPIPPESRSSAFSPGGDGKGATYLIVGVAALGLAGVAWWLVK